MKRLVVVFCIMALLLSACGTAVTPLPAVPTVEAGSRDRPVPTSVKSIFPLPTPRQETDPEEHMYLPFASMLTSTVEAAAPQNYDWSLSGDEEAWVETTLQGMSLQEKIGQLLLVSFDDTGLSPEVCTALQGIQPAGVRYRPGIVRDPWETRDLSAALQDCAAEAQTVPLFVGMNHEGQYITHFEHMTLFPAALALGAAGDPDLAFPVAEAAGQELAFSGINLVLGPVADVLTNLDNEVISQRTFGGDPAVVSQFVAQATGGYMQGGVIPVLKHFPGHGGVAEDSHRVLPVDPAGRQELESIYLPPFRAGLQAGAPVVMLTHVAFPGITGDGQPATLSVEILRMLREDLGFNGIVLSDAMNMNAITQAAESVEEVALQAVNSGTDLLLMTSIQQAQTTQAYLVAAAQDGRLRNRQINDSVRRILRVKAAWGLQTTPQPQTAEPDWQAHRELALEAGRRAVTLYRDRADLLPVPEGVRRVLVVGPTPDWSMYPQIEQVFASRGIETDFVHFTLPEKGPVPEVELLDSLPDQAAGYDLVIFFAWQAHLDGIAGDRLQAGLVGRLLERSTPLVVIAIKSPTDILAFPEAPTYLAMFGTTDGQVQAVLDILTGTASPAGQNPLPALNP